MRRSILACGLLFAFAGIASAVADAARSVGPFGSLTATGPTSLTATSTTVQRRAGRHAVVYWRRHVRLLRAGARHWLTIIRTHPPRQATRTLAAHSVTRLRHLSAVWRRRDHAAFRRAHHPPLFGAWLCIHRYEGSWQDAGAPYYGGLQMDLSFQQRYGGWLLRSKGTANHWTVLEQIWVAVHAWRARGFSPWPNTARYCGY